MPKTGDHIGPYTLISKLGRGAFGVVWLAEKRSALATTKVALKLPNDEDVDLEAVKQEASIWVHASGHPNVLPIIDADVYGEQVVIVSEYAPDGSLSKWLESHGHKAPSVESAVEMTLGILAGLEHLHERGIIHRDLKPDNILLQRETPRLADFGIARILKTSSRSTVAAGTPVYMSPEAFDGKRNEQTDIWSVGVIFYRLLSGRLPFQQVDSASLLAAIISKDPAPLSASIPAQIRSVVERALNKSLQKRWRSAREMRQALRTAIPIGELSKNESKPGYLSETVPAEGFQKPDPTIPIAGFPFQPNNVEPTISATPPVVPPVRSGSKKQTVNYQPSRSRKLLPVSAGIFGILIVLSAILYGYPSSCRRQSNVFLIALSDNIKTIDPIGSPSVDAASERVRTLMFNSLVKKDEKFDYVPELAQSIYRSEDGLEFTFILRTGVTFHDGRPFTSADAKYTLDTVLASTFAKAASFFEGSGANKKAYIKSVEAPFPNLLIIRLNNQWTGLLPNLVPIAIIPKDSYESQKTHPLGTGPFKFKSYDQVQQVVDMEANQNYWDGAPQIPAVRARAISESNQMQAELQSGRVDIAPLPTSLSPDAIKALGQNANLSVNQFVGSNLNLLTFNTAEAPLNNVKVRQAIAYAIDRQSMVRDLALGQGAIAHSILPEGSWAYVQGWTYEFDPNKAKQLLDEAEFRDPDGDGPQMRWAKPLLFRISGSSAAARQYASVIQNYLKDVGVPVTIETSEFNTMREQLQNGQFQITYGQWVGGNQDPIFYHDLFATSEIPTQTRAARNRSRYSNPTLDKILVEAANTYDHAKAAPLYAKAQEIISRDVPVFPMWYQANMVIAKKSVGNIHVNASGDWGFVKDLTVQR